MRKGFGAKSLGEAIANTKAFAQCQPSKAFEAVCGFKPREKDSEFVDTLVADFTSNGYQLKKAFIKSAIYCLGESK